MRRSGCLLFFGAAVLACARASDHDSLQEDDGRKLAELSHPLSAGIRGSEADDLPLKRSWWRELTKNGHGGKSGHKKDSSDSSSSSDEGEDGGGRHHHHGGKGSGGAGFLCENGILEGGYCCSKMCGEGGCGGSGCGSRNDVTTADDCCFSHITEYCSVKGCAPCMMDEDDPETDPETDPENDAENDAENGAEDEPENDPEDEPEREHEREHEREPKRQPKRENDGRKNKRDQEDCDEDNEEEGGGDEGNYPEPEAERDPGSEPGRKPEREPERKPEREPARKPEREPKRGKRGGKKKPNQEDCDEDSEEEDGGEEDIGGDEESDGNGSCCKKTSDLLRVVVENGVQEEVYSNGPISIFAGCIVDMEGLDASVFLSAVVKPEDSDPEEMEYVMTSWEDDIQTATFGEPYSTMPESFSWEEYMWTDVGTYGMISIATASGHYVGFDGSSMMTSVVSSEEEPGWGCASTIKEADTTSTKRCIIMGPLEVY